MLILETPRLRLRWFRAADAGFIRRLLNDPGWLNNIGDRGIRTRGHAERWIESRHLAVYGRLGFGFWAIERRTDGVLVGMCGLIRRDTLPEVDLGYALLARYRGHGYAREAAAACLAYAHDVLGLAEVWGITGPDNAASAAVMSGIGMVDAGLHRLAGEERETWLFRAPTNVLGDDRAQIDALTGRFLGAFTNRDDTIPTLAALPHYFSADAVVHVADTAGALRSTDVHGFIGPRAELLSSGRLVDFEEHETESRTDLNGSIAHRWLRYAKRGTLEGRMFEGGGTKSLQFVRAPDGWKIAALTWQDDA